jgi:hypothetical protein
VLELQNFYSQSGREMRSIKLEFIVFVSTITVFQCVPVHQALLLLPLSGEPKLVILIELFPGFLQSFKIAGKHIRNRPQSLLPTF